MVDLACLLLTFFMLTTAFTKPKVMEIVMPRENKDQKNEVDKKRVINIILAENDQVFFYNGMADPTTGSLPTMIKSNLTDQGIRKILLHRNRDLFEQIYYFNDSVARELGEYTKTTRESAEKRIKKMRMNDTNGPVILIKAAEGTKYGTVVNVLDEMSITNIARFAVVNINSVEKKMLQDALNGKNLEIQ
jgi:biopolymer transport protein ExbD